MKKYITLAIVLITVTLHGQSENTVTNEKVLSLNNTQWVGELMYLDYSNGKETTLKTNMQITTKNNKITMNTQFVYEPSAISKNTIKFKKNGTYFGNEKITNKSVSADGTITVITTCEGRDNNEPPTITKTYNISELYFSVTKEVQFKDAKTKFIRNRSTYIKLL